MPAQDPRPTTTEGIAPMPDLNIASWVPGTINAEFTHKASEAAFIGDLAYYDASNNVLRSASTMTDAGSTVTPQNFATQFAGVFRSKQLSTDAVARNARVIIDEIFEFPCVSATFVAGDYVKCSYDAGNSKLFDQKVEKTTDPLAAIGRVIKYYSAATTKVKVRLTSRILAGIKKITASGSITADDLTGTDSSLGISGQASSTGGAIVVAGGASSGAAAGGLVSVTGGAGGASQTGGAVSMVGGVPASGNAAGGTGTFSAGAGAGTGAGGAVTSRGGASGSGATGNGGAWSGGGGAALSTNGTGGAATFTGGVATGTGTGGAVTITSGASAGASGTAGAVAIDTGAATGGTAGAITIGTTNAGSITIGLASVATIFGGPITNSVGGSTAAAGSTVSDAGQLPSGTAFVYPTTAADGTKGVKLATADKVTGRTVFIGNGVSNQILKVYGPSGASINGAAGDAAFSSASGKGVLITCLSGAGNTWLAM